MRALRLAALGVPAVLGALGLAGAVAWRLHSHQRAAVPPETAVVPITVTAIRLGVQRPPSVTLPPLPLVDRARLDAVSGDPVLRFGTIDVCGVGHIPGQWQRPSPEADEMAFELPPALAIDAPDAAMDQLVLALQQLELATPAVPRCC